MLSRRFLAGHLVEVRSEAEILATLDPQGTLDGLPFMPEMFEFCGRRFRVAKRAEKTCDTISSYTSRQMIGAVHLDDLRCSGEAHGGCQARCLLFWKDDWLRAVAADVAPPGPTARRGLSITRDGLLRVTRRPSAVEGADALFVCQATELVHATKPLAWWDPRQYLRELATRNVAPLRMLAVMARAAWNAVARRLRPLGVRPTPWVEGITDPRPTAILGLQPGERVRVRPLAEIAATLDERRNARGLSFDVEMVPFCGREYTVSHRIERLVDERTGRMLRVSKDAIVLDGVTCGGCLSQDRLFCPRGIHPFWREGWLERVGDSRPAMAAEGRGTE